MKMINPIFREIFPPAKGTLGEFVLGIILTAVSPLMNSQSKMPLECTLLGMRID